MKPLFLGLLFSVIGLKASAQLTKADIVGTYHITKVTNSGEVIFVGTSLQNCITHALGNLKTKVKDYTAQDSIMIVDIATNMYNSAQSDFIEPLADGKANGMENGEKAENASWEFNEPKQEFILIEASGKRTIWKASLVNNMVTLTIDDNGTTQVEMTKQ